MHICLFEDAVTENFRPLVDLRPVYDLRTGMRTNLERTRELFPDAGILLHTRSALKGAAIDRYDAPVNRIPGELNVLFLNGRLLLEKGAFIEELQRIVRGKDARVMMSGGEVAAAWVPEARIDLSEGRYLTADTFDGLASEDVGEVSMISRTWHLLDHLHDMLEADYARQARGYNVLERPGASIHESVVMIEPERIHVAPGARIMPGAVISAADGPVFIDRSAVVMEHAVLRGPLYLGPHSQAKIHSQIDGGSFGTCVKLGGEVHDAIIHSYSNKAHLGFLGDAYLGCWCNMGAGTNNSNLKNDYSETDLYNIATGEFENTGRQFTGLVMGDHSKCGIATRFNTASVIGTYCNILGEGFQPRVVPSFAWGGPGGFVDYRIDKAIEVARAMMKRRDIELSEAEEELLRAEYERVTAGRTEVTAL